MGRNNNRQATNITSRINVMEPVPNVDINYGPYESVHDAFVALTGNNAVALGLTVGIVTEGVIKEYWFESGTTEYDLVEKLSGEGTMNYNDLTHKPCINEVKLTEETTLTDIGAASDETVDNHIKSTKIHTPITFNNEVIESINFTENKMTIVCNKVSYEFKLTKIQGADFYVLFGVVTTTKSANDFGLMINGNYKNYAEVTVEDILSLATTQEERDGYYVLDSEDKLSFVTATQGTVDCDYSHTVNAGENAPTAMFVLCRTSGDTAPAIIYSIYTYDSDTYVYNKNSRPVVDNFNLNLAKSKLDIGNDTYDLFAYTKQDLGEIVGSFCINFSKSTEPRNENETEEPEVEPEENQGEPEENPGETIK